MRRCSCGTRRRGRTGELMPPTVPGPEAARGSARQPVPPACRAGWADEPPHARIGSRPSVVGRAPSRAPARRGERNASIARRIWWSGSNDRLALAILSPHVLGSASSSSVSPSAPRLTRRRSARCAPRPAIDGVGAAAVACIGCGRLRRGSAATGGGSTSIGAAQVPDRPGSRWRSAPRPARWSGAPAAPAAGAGCR